MTDNEKNKLIATWAGKNPVARIGFDGEIKCYTIDGSNGIMANYLHDNWAAVCLLDVLVGKDVYWFMRSYQKGKIMVELRDIHGNPLIPIQIKPSISEAICGAILALIEKESTNG